ncbi:TPA: metallophosphoesterase, partial [Streptococcus pneumoniae]
MAIYYSVSDIHGHYNEFIKSLNKIDLSDKQSKLILLGDYIDYGSQSFQVISKIIELEKIYPKQIITLFGNHEEWFYDWLI